VFQVRKFFALQNPDPSISMQKLENLDFNRFVTFDDLLVLKTDVNVPTYSK
jgi:hypothetical protein